LRLVAVHGFYNPKPDVLETHTAEQLHPWLKADLLLI
jgi:hypothetical protein